MKIEEGKVVTLEFKVYNKDNGDLLEDTQDVGPFFYIQGFGNFVPAIEEALEGQEKGYTTTIELTPEEGYGDYDEELIIEMDRSEF
ncbi:MAG: FKBP-type peptidyl-prolyl cis-trans isomerase, partial [Cetobacterium sp.]